MKFSIKGIPNPKEEKELIWSLSKTKEGVALVVTEKGSGCEWYVFGVREKDGLGVLYPSLPGDLGLPLTHDIYTITLTKEK